MHKPELLILDEPTTGLDPQTRKLLWDVVRNLRRTDGMTVLLTTHYMEEAADADYVVIIDSGKISAEGTPLELKNKYTGDFITLYGVSEDNINNLGLPFEKIRDAVPGFCSRHKGSNASSYLNTPNFFLIMKSQRAKWTMFSLPSQARSPREVKTDEFARKSYKKQVSNCFSKIRVCFFPSLITPLILLVLYITFLAKVYKDSFLSSLEAAHIADFPQELIDATVGGQLFSSLLAVCCITVAFCCNMTMVQDKVTGARQRPDDDTRQKINACIELLPFNVHFNIYHLSYRSKAQVLSILQMWAGIFRQATFCFRCLTCSCLSCSERRFQASSTSF